MKAVNDPLKLKNVQILSLFTKDVVMEPGIYVYAFTVMQTMTPIDKGY